MRICVFFMGELRGARPSAEADGRKGAGGEAAACRIRRSRMRRAAPVRMAAFVGVRDIAKMEKAAANADEGLRAIADNIGKADAERSRRNSVTLAGLKRLVDGMDRV